MRTSLRPRRSTLSLQNNFTIKSVIECVDSLQHAITYLSWTIKVGCACLLLLSDLQAIPMGDRGLTLKNYTVKYRISFSTLWAPTLASFWLNAHACMTYHRLRLFGLFYIFLCLTWGETVGSGNNPSLSHQWSTTEMSPLPSVPETRHPRVRPLFDLLPVNDSATSRKGWSAAV